jgi:glucose/arabinose dehydrogenase
MGASDRFVMSNGVEIGLNGADLRRKHVPAHRAPRTTPRTATLDVRAQSSYAKYIGRVGALAVALGVTGAMATSPGIAWADNTTRSVDSSSSTTDTDTSSAPTDRPSPAHAGAEDDSLPKISVAKADGPIAARTLDDDLTIGLAGEDDASEAVDGPELEDTELDAPAGDEEPPTDPDAGPPEEPALDPPADPPAAPAEELPPAGNGNGHGNEGLTGSGSDPQNGTNGTNGTDQETTADTAAEIIHSADEPSLSANNDALRTASNAGATALALSTAISPMHATPTANPIATLIAQIPTPGEVLAGVKRFVTQCACALINGALNLLGNATAAGGAPGAPASPAGNPLAWAVLGWVRRQVDFAVGLFNRTPVGQWVHEVGVSARTWIGNIGNSPWGRNISARIGAFVAECDERTGLPEGFDRTTLIAGLNEPTDFELIMHSSGPGEAPHIDRILITEKSGTIKSYSMHTGELTTLLNLAVVTANGERGLIGIEVDPNFSDSTAVGYQKIYVAYTNADNRDQLSSFTLVGDTLSDEQALVTSTLDANAFHHGGELEFDPEGKYLYWAVGNNTVPSDNSQIKTNIHGKILRINRDGSGVVDNPFYVAGGDENTNRIYALGLRNPFRFAVDQENGAVLSGDVGEGKWEELNLITPGGNYGWPGAEGNAPAGTDFVDPIYAYPHATGFGNGSITTVMVYDDGAPVAGQKKVLIADYSLGWIRQLTFNDDYTDLIAQRTFDSGAGSVVKLSQGPEGEIYQLNIYPGALLVIRPSDGNRSPVAVIDASVKYGAGNSLTVDFDASGSTDPDSGDSRTYSWDFGNGQTSTSATQTVTFTNSGNFTAYNVTLTVTDELGKQSTATQRIVVGSTPPVADFDVQGGSYKYNAGQTLSFSATGTDPQDTPGGEQLDADSFSWRVVFHHADHTHPFISEVEGPDLTFEIPVDFHQLYNTHYNVILTVTDSSGLKTVVEKEINPNLVTLRFETNVVGAKYTLDGMEFSGTHTEQAVVGVKRTLGAISPQTVNNQQYTWDNWSDTEGSTHIITTPGTDHTYKVNYVLAPAPALAV